MPIQPVGAQGIRGELILNPAFIEGLKDLDGFSHIYLIYFFHKSEGYHLQVPPFLDDELHGVFATRAPRRPNQIGLSLVKLIAIQDEILILEDVDMLDGTPVLDIKPYVPIFEQKEVYRIGWLAGNEEKVRTKRSDGRFNE